MNMGEENALLMIFVIPPMAVASAVGTYVTVHVIRKRMDRLLNGIQSVGNGNLEVRLDTADAGEYKIVYENFNRIIQIYPVQCAHYDFRVLCPDADGIQDRAGYGYFPGERRGVKPYFLHDVSACGNPAVK